MRKSFNSDKKHYTISSSFQPTSFGRNVDEDGFALFEIEEIVERIFSYSATAFRAVKSINSSIAFDRDCYEAFVSNDVTLGKEMIVNNINTIKFLYNKVKHSKKHLSKLLWFSVSVGNLEAVKFLVEKKVETEFPSDTLRTACSRGHFEVMEYLINTYALSSEVCSQILEVAVRLKRLDMIKLLLDAGADIDYKDGEPLNTAIDFYCITKERVEVVKYLIDSGANVDCVYFEKTITFDIDDIDTFKLQMEVLEYIKSALDKKDIL